MITLAALGLKLEALRTKDESFQAYKVLSSWAQVQRRTHQRLRSDPGGEFTSNQFTAYLQQQGTERRLTMDNTLRHNSVAESLNHRLM